MNSKYRYYITDLLDGCIYGTNDKEIAENHSLSEDFFVVDAVDGMWLTSSEEKEPVKELK